MAGLLAIAGCEATGVVKGHAVVALLDEAFAAETCEEAADGFARQADHAAEVFLTELHAEGDGKVCQARALGSVVGAGPVDECTGELTRGRGMEGEATRGEEGALVLAGNG